MEIQDFVGHYKNHPVLFIGTGFGDAANLLI